MKPKLDTIVIVVKVACLTYIPGGSALVAGLGEVGVTTLFGMPVKFWQLVIAASVASAGGLAAAMSSSFHTFIEAQKNGAAKP